jgi:PKD repeat protein
LGSEKSNLFVEGDVHTSKIPMKKAPTRKTIAVGVVLGGLAFFAWGNAVVASAQTRTLRIVTYNIQCDAGFGSAPLAGLICPFSGTGTYTATCSGSVTNGGVLEGIGEELLNENYQPIDVLALQETSSASATVLPILSGLNAFYASRGIPAVYTNSSLVLTSTGGSGGGPSTLVYNTNTVHLVESVAVGTPSSSGIARQIGRYLLAPAGVATNASNVFYVYVSHAKAGTTSSDLARRAIEGGLLRTNSATLPAGSRVLYVGDYNTSNSSEGIYQALVGTALMGIQGFDPFNPSGASGINWSTGSLLDQKTESCRSLRYRDDFQLMSSNVYYGVVGGLAYVSGTYHTFGINGTVPYQGNIINSANNSLNGNLQPNPPISAEQCYTNLYGASDHLPVVADYTIPVPSSSPVASFTASPTNGTELLAVTFADTSTGTITNRFWDFGDSGTTNVTTNSVTHVYAAGTNTVTLIVSGPDGVSTNTKASYITVLSVFEGWQAQYFGNSSDPDAAPDADPDGDGCNNLCEFQAGTDPTNGASYLHITALSVQGGDVLVTWATGWSRTNVVQAAAGLPDGSYSNDFGDISPWIILPPGSGLATTNFPDPSAATNAPARYYRIRLVP